MAIQIDLSGVLKRILVIGKFGKKLSNQFTRFNGVPNLTYAAFVKAIDPKSKVGLLDQTNIFFNALAPLSPPNKGPDSPAEFAAAVSKRIVQDIDDVIRGMQVFSSEVTKAINQVELQNSNHPAGLLDAFFAAGVGQLEPGIEEKFTLEYLKAQITAPNITDAQIQAAKNDFATRARTVLAFGDQSATWANAILQFATSEKIAKCRAAYTELLTLVSTGVLDSVNRIMVVEHLREIAKSAFLDLKNKEGEAFDPGTYKSLETQLMFSIVKKQLQGNLSEHPRPLNVALESINNEKLVKPLVQRLPVEAEEELFKEKLNAFVAYHKNEFATRNQQQQLRDSSEYKLKLIFEHRVWPAITGQPKLLKDVLLKRISFVLEVAMPSSNELKEASDQTEAASLLRQHEFLSAISENGVDQQRMENVFNGLNEVTKDSIQGGLKHENQAADKIGIALRCILAAQYLGKGVLTRCSAFFPVSAEHSNLITSVKLDKDRGVKAIKERMADVQEAEADEHGEGIQDELEVEESGTQEASARSIVANESEQRTGARAPVNVGANAGDGSIEPISPTEPSTSPVEPPAPPAGVLNQQPETSGVKEDSEWEKELEKMLKSLGSDSLNPEELRSNLAKVIHNALVRTEVETALANDGDHEVLTSLREFYFCMILFAHQDEARIGRDGSGTLAFTRSLLEHNGKIDKLFANEALNGFFKEMDWWGDERAEGGFAEFVNKADEALPTLRRELTSRLSDLYGIQKLFESAVGSKAEIIVFNGTANDFLGQYLANGNCASNMVTNASSLIPCLAVLTDSAFVREDDQRQLVYDTKGKAAFVKGYSHQINDNGITRELPPLLFSAGPNWDTSDAFDDRWGNVSEVPAHVHPTGPGLRFRKPNDGQGSMPVVPAPFMIAAAALRKFANANKEPNLGNQLTLPHECLRGNANAIGRLILEHNNTNYTAGPIKFCQDKFFTWDANSSLLPDIFAWLGILAVHSTSDPAQQAKLRKELTIVYPGQGWPFSYLSPKRTEEMPSSLIGSFSDTNSLLISEGIRLRNQSFAAHANRWLAMFSL